MIHPRTLQVFAEKVAQAQRTKQASLGSLALLGAGGVGAMGLMGTAGLAGNVRRDMNYGRAERLEEKAKQMKALMAAKNMPAYQGGFGGGMH